MERIDAVQEPRERRGAINLVDERQELGVRDRADAVAGLHVGMRPIDDVGVGLLRAGCGGEGCEAEGCNRE